MSFSFRDLFEWPAWEPKELGRSVPDTIHAVSVALPQWADVIGYEEKKPEVMSRLKSGYPRFFIHKLIQQLADQMAPGQPCLPFPSISIAERCSEYVRKSTGQNAKVVMRRGIQGVATTFAGEAALREFWMHSGMIVSTRQAETRLAGERDLHDAPAVRESLCKQLAALYHCDEDDVFLMPTGMAAQYQALRILMRRAPHQPTIQLGFPYVDTLKIQQKFGYAGILLHKLDKITSDFAGIVRQHPIAGCFCEIPGNPQLGSADLQTISPILRQRRIPLVIDDVIATPFNIDPFKFADVVATSLTKFIAGSGDVMGGALIFNSRSPMYLELKNIADAMHEELLWGEDAQVIDQSIRDFPERMAQHNKSGLFIAERLRQHPAVERVWYPKWEFSDQYEAVRRPEGGWGAVITFLPKNAATEAPRVYDALRVCKGPSLGTGFTLACPFTILAHYQELEWAESCGVNRNLIRLSIGMEDPEDLWHRLEVALGAGPQTPAAS
jgi:cystathionine gamma-synthase